MVPIAWNVVAPIGQMLLGAGQSLFGANQRSQARNDLEQLYKETPEMYISEATRKLANEPVSEELLNQLVESRARRTSQSLGAISASDPASAAFMAGRIGDQERRQERADMANVEQKRIDALARLGAEEQSLQQRKMELWKNRVAGAQAEMGAGQENIFGGAGEFLRGLSYGADKWIEDGNPFKRITNRDDSASELTAGIQEDIMLSGGDPWATGDIQDVGIDEEEGEDFNFRNEPTINTTTWSKGIPKIELPQTVLGGIKTGNPEIDILLQEALSDPMVLADILLRQKRKN